MILNIIIIIEHYFFIVYELFWWWWWGGSTFHYTLITAKQHKQNKLDGMYLCVTAAWWELNNCFHRKKCPFGKTPPVNTPL